MPGVEGAYSGALRVFGTHGVGSPVRALSCQLANALPSRRGQDRRVDVYKSATNIILSSLLFRYTHILPQIPYICVTNTMRVAMNKYYGKLRHFCDDPGCPDPVWKLSTNVRKEHIANVWFVSRTNHYVGDLLRFVCRLFRFVPFFNYPFRHFWF